MGGEFGVYLLGFGRTEEGAVERLATLFDLDEATAASLVRGAPIAVKRHASRETALAIERGLRSIGADVDVRAEVASQAPPGAASSPPAAPFPPAANAARTAPLVGLRRAAVVSRPPSQPPPPARSLQPPPQDNILPPGPSGFWPRIPVAFVVPFMGGGILWLVALAVMLVVLSLSSAAPCLNVVLMPITASVYLGLMSIYFTQCAEAGLESDGTKPAPRFSMPHQHDVVYRGFALCAVTLLLFCVPAILAYRDAPKSWVYAAGLVPYIYWPMALTVSGITGSLGSLFNPVDIIKGIVAGGLPYVVVVLFGYGAYAGLSLLPAVAAPAGGAALLVAFAAIVVGVGYIAGVQAFLMGCLVSSRPERFESLTSGPVDHAQ